MNEILFVFMRSDVDGGAHGRRKRKVIAANIIFMMEAGKWEEFYGSFAARTKWDGVKWCRQKCCLSSWEWNWMFLFCELLNVFLFIKVWWIFRQFVL
jgi:hypothetical protein